MTDIEQNQKELNEIRDEMALDEAQFCHCSGGACSGCEKSTIKIFKRGFDKGAEEMAKIKDAQILELGTALESIVGCEADLFGDDIVKALENFRKEVK